MLLLTGQKVILTVDAFPDKSYTGKIFSIANIGEELPNTDKFKLKGTELIETIKTGRAVFDSDSETEIEEEDIG